MTCESGAEVRIRYIVKFTMIFGLMGCFAWGPRASKYLPETTALQQHYDYDGEVIIIGAGAAGLAAARVLEENNVSYVILEATARLGGRLGESTEFADFPIDLGAEWIHNNAEILDVLTGEPGTAASIELIPYHLKNAGRWDGESYETVSQWELDARFSYFPEYKFKNSTWFNFVRTHFGVPVEEKIKYESPVTAIDYSGERVEVKTEEGQLFVADKVLVTVSVGVLKADVIAFNPPLSATKRAAFEEVEFDQGFKLFLKFSEQFYPDAIECTGEAVDKAYWDVTFGKDVNDHVLGLLARTPSVENYYALGSEEAIVTAVLEELDLMFDGAASRTYTEEYMLLDWGRQEHVRGTWVEGFLIENATLETLNASLAHKVYFAGEVNDARRQLGVPGAILSGFDAVDRLLKGQD
ncbi:MAG: hypothetical protein CMH56_02570 [Myxococcales bacterium]|nr:hypothetical protein [Myxococcales bacterium]